MIPAFPKLVPLNLEDKAVYNGLIAEFPYHSDTSFTTLHIWWNLEKRLSIASLNGNVVINYHLAHDPQNSGYSLVGRRAIDDSIQTIFDHLRQEHQAVKLVHVPAFVVDEVKHPEQLAITEEPDYNEYILDSQATAALQGGTYASTRRRVNRFLREIGDRALTTRALDLSAAAVREQLLGSIQAWEEKHPWKNDPGRTEYQALQKTVEHAATLDIQNLGLYVDDTLCAVILYHLSLDRQYYIIHHIKVDRSLVYIVDYVQQLIAQKAAAEKVPFINMEMDLGIAGLREHKLGLKPVNFLRKYTVCPS